MNMVYSLIAVAVISAVILGSARAVFIVCLCVCTVDIDLLGLLWTFGFDLNSITMISLVMAIGLVVDYLAHVVHYFIASPEQDPKQVMVG